MVKRPSLQHQADFIRTVSSVGKRVQEDFFNIQMHCLHLQRFNIVIRFPEITFVDFVSAANLETMLIFADWINVGLKGVVPVSGRLANLFFDIIRETVICYLTVIERGYDVKGLL